jgi:hypothetical protein
MEAPLWVGVGTRRSVARVRSSKTGGRARVYALGYQEATVLGTTVEVIELSERDDAQ